MTQPALNLMHEAAFIRPASEKDIPQISALAHRIWPLCFAGILTPVQVANMLERIYNEENLKTEMAQGHRFFLASENTRFVGYASAYKDGNTVWLKKLYLESVARGKGTGARLMETAVAAFLPAKEIRLLVNNDNISAQQFYERSGYKRIGEKQVMMGDYPFTDYIYCKGL
jgi:ribosomal protein S18 acetylase RimI-like enzyme